LGSNILIGPGVRIISANHSAGNLQRYDTAGPIKIESDVWIGANAILLPEVTIGRNAIIGAGAVVARAIPENTVAVGVPAKCKKISTKT
jgi:acetyltransferase-like isoleucine patch superfamily enzyme